MQLARRATDLALLGVLAVLLGFSAYELARVWGSGYWVLDAVAGAVVGVVALVRRRDRWRTAIAGLSVAAVAVVIARVGGLPTEPGPGMALALAVLVGSGVATLPRIQAILIAAGGAVVSAGSMLSSQGSGVSVVNATAWLIAMIAGAGLRWRDVRRTATANRIRQDERLNLARELHDVVAHHISGIVLQAQGARIAGRRHPAEYDNSLAGIESAGAEALTAMRRVVGLLRDDDVVPGPVGLDHLRELVERFNAHGPKTTLQLPPDEPPWPPEVTTTISRVVQESLTNVARHAPHADTVTVKVLHAEDEVTVEIADNAEPAPARYQRSGFGLLDQRSGFGLLGIRERVEALGGTLSAGPRPTPPTTRDTTLHGWTVSASLPLDRTSHR
ncbi:histidine kinase [Kribbella hippodromi]|uniref:histidine kinase n=1 Tax=Kribbella hippodromi TaxID=434347 RepID=A0ABN2EEP2_9ACTN